MGKTLHLFMLLALFFLTGGSISANAQETKTFSFAQTSKTEGTLTDAPTGVTATFENTDRNANDQLTADKSMTLTISGLAEGTKITGVNLNVHNNKSKGNGTATVTLGDATLGTLAITGLGATYVSKDVTPFTEGSVANEQNLVITIKATVKSVYCNKFTISYQEPASGKIATTLTFTDPADKTFDLNATEGTNFTNAATLTPAVEGATITYSSDNENVAIVDENGGVLVTTDKEGKATITAKYAGNDKYDPATASYTITVKDPNQPRWIKTDLTALTPTDQFVIVDLTSKTAMSNDKGTTEAPVATAITLSDDGTELTGEIADNLKWNVTATNGAYTFYPNGSTSTWLYVSGSSSNNNLRVGTGDDKTFTYYASGNYSGLKGTDGTNDRYIHEYSNQDWRTYKNTTQTSTSIAYFKRVSAGAATTLTLDENATEATITAGKNVNVTLKRTFNDNAWNTLVLPFDLTADQIAAAFGADAKVAAYTGATAGADGTYTLNFKEATTITANTPVFIHSAQNNSDGYTFTGVEVKNTTPTQTADGFNFVGTYTATTVPVGNYFINSSNKFFKAGDDKTNIKGTRATFEPVGAATSAKGLGFNVTEDGTTTAINSITMQEELNANAPMYNLAGQQVTKAYKGVILQNGKKFINK